MIKTYIKYYFFLIIIIYSFGKMLNQKFSSKQTLSNLFILLCTNLLIVFIRIKYPYLTIFILLIIIFIHTTLTYKRTFQLTLITSLIAIGICYFLFFISTIIPSFLLTIIHSNTEITATSQLLHLILSIVIELFMYIIIFNIQRFKKGMPFLYSKISNSIGIIVACCILIISSLLTALDPSSSTYGWIIFASLLFGLMLFIWWRKQLTNLYVKRSYQNELARITAELDSLRQENERLGAIVHKDNKLIPAMIMSVQNALSSHVLTNDTPNEKLHELLSTLEKLTNERSSLTIAQLSTKCNIPTSNIARLDMMIRYMQQKAHSLNIKLSVDFHTNINEMLTDYFTEDVLVTIMADLIDNAIIATKLSTENKEIYIDFNKENNHYNINVYDTGIPFEASTIRYAGIKKASTHLDTGGSGIGLMATFSSLRECGGSFVIDETINISPYTKKVSIVMDYLNEFRVYSNRNEILTLVHSNPNIHINP